ncbi:sphingosine N-acyltransferase [Malassezia cuniculi]|uniref:Sphingosine N-acyltransferase n=1 Tax=Malassezia cuniculi TaxID=948313 RepID=A0AAF0J5A0_9BASI|nr:sphingosine N-acyltransferase [Malassezia cuniculi]
MATDQKVPRAQAPRITFAVWSTVISVVLVAALLTVHYASGASRCGSHAWLDWAFDSVAWTGITRPDMLTAQDVCYKVHEFTSSCLLLSGEVVPATPIPSSISDQLWSGIFSLRELIHGSTRTVLYERHWNDLRFAATWGLILYALRGVLVAFVLEPLGWLLVERPTGELAATEKGRRRLRKTVTRFAEQGWILLLYSTSFALVCDVIRRQPFWPNKSEYLWIDYPFTTMDAATKALYLWEASNYLHQLIVVSVEEKRSDFTQMMVHHIVTLTLIFGSYACCLHPVGIAVLFLLDPSDILLAAAKLIRYAGYRTLCDIAFGLFMISWIVMRHGIYSYVYYSCIVEVPKLIQFTDKADFASGHVMTDACYWIFIGLLGVLQFILLIWCSMILGVAYRVLTKKGAEDSRSDDSLDEE